MLARMPIPTVISTAAQIASRAKDRNLPSLKKLWGKGLPAIRETTYNLDKTQEPEHLTMVLYHTAAMFADATQTWDKEDSTPVSTRTQTVILTAAQLVSGGKDRNLPNLRKQWGKDLPVTRETIFSSATSSETGIQAMDTDAICAKPP